MTDEIGDVWLATNLWPSESIVVGVGKEIPVFEEFYAAHASRMVKVAHSIVRDRHAAEDVVQTALAKAYASWWRISRLSNPVAYTRRMVVNAALAHLRRPSLRHEQPTADPSELLARASHDPSGSVVTIERDWMWVLLGQLPPRRRAVVVLRYYEGLSEVEIAQVLGCRPGTVKSQAAAALSAMRQQLDPRLNQSQNLTHDIVRGPRR